MPASKDQSSRESADLKGHRFAGMSTPLALTRNLSATSGHTAAHHGDLVGLRWRPTEKALSSAAYRGVAGHFPIGTAINSSE
jgi:hypothetical protein